jgi:hypothetical protein
MTTHKVYDGAAPIGFCKDHFSFEKIVKLIPNLFRAWVQSCEKGMDS